MIKKLTSSAREQFLDKRFLRFIIIGISNTILSYLLFISILTLCLHLQINFAVFIAQFTACTIALIWSYIWNRLWSFQSQKSKKIEFTKFIISQIFYMVLTAVALHLLIMNLNLNPTLSWVGVMGIATILNYLILRNLVFTSP